MAITKEGYEQVFKISSQDKSRNKVFKLEILKFRKKKWEGTGSLVELLIERTDSLIILLLPSQ